MSYQPTYLRKYRIPEVKPEAQAVSLKDFALDDIREYLKRVDAKSLDSPAGETPDLGQGFGELTLSVSDLSRILTLAITGQTEHARAEIVQIVSEHVGRPL